MPGFNHFERGGEKDMCVHVVVLIGGLQLLG